MDLRARVADTTPSDDERWSAALAQVARRAPRTEEGVRRGPRQLTWLSTVVGVLTVLSSVLLVLQLLGGGPSWRQTLAGVAAVSLVVLCLAGAVLAWSGGTLHNSWQDVQKELTRAQRRHVARQLRGRVPVDPAHVPLVREWAWQQMRQVPLVLLAFGVQQGRMGDLHARDAFLHWFGVGTLVVWLVLLGRTAVELRRVRRFVHAHPEPPRG